MGSRKTVPTENQGSLDYGSHRSENLETYFVIFTQGQATGSLIDRG